MQNPIMWKKEKRRSAVYILMILGIFECAAEGIIELKGENYHDY
jgi:hypothetical protein